MYSKGLNQGREMVIQIFVLHYCAVILSSSCTNCSTQSVSNYSMSSARPSIQPEMMLISKKSTNAISTVTSKLALILVRDMV